MSRGDYTRLPLHAFSESTSRRRSESGGESPTNHYTQDFPDAPPHAWRRRWFTAKHQLLRPRVLITILKFVVPCIVLLVLGGLLVWEPHIELAFYSRDWIQAEIETVLPLAGCFRPDRISPQYNVSEALNGLRQTEVHAGLPLRLGMDCYDFAGTIQGGRPVDALRGEERTYYHTYWRTDLAAFGPRQEWMLKSFFATQDTEHTTLVLWSNGDLSGNPILASWLMRYPEAFELRVVNYDQLARGTELEGSELLRVKDTRAWIDGDLVRLLVLWAYGGVWVDMDSLLTRDLAPLLEHEFVTQWDCYGESTLARATATFSHRRRQALRALQRGPHALPAAFPLPLRSLPHHGDIPASP